jgi:hypothetical protein
MVILLKAKCLIIQPNWRVVRSKFDIDPEGHEPFGEYGAFNLLRERGDLIDGQSYQIQIIPLIPRLKG